MIIYKNEIIKVIKTLLYSSFNRLFLEYLLSWYFPVLLSNFYSYVSNDAVLFCRIKIYVFKG